MALNFLVLETKHRTRWVAKWGSEVPGKRERDGVQRKSIIIAIHTHTPAHTDRQTGRDARTMYISQWAQSGVANYPYNFATGTNEHKMDKTAANNEKNQKTREPNR